MPPASRQRSRLSGQSGVRSTAVPARQGTFGEARILLSIERLVGQLVGELLDVGFSLLDLWLGHLALRRGWAGICPHGVCANAEAYDNITCPKCGKWTFPQFGQVVR